MPNLADWTLLALVIALAVEMYEQAKQIAWLGERLREMDAEWLRTAEATRE